MTLEHQPNQTHRSLAWQAKQNLRRFCPQPILNWREEVYYRRYGEIELHLVEFLCDRRRDAVDVGAHEGCYIYWLKRHARHVVALEPLPWLAEGLVAKFGNGITARNLALSRGAGKAILRMPVIDGIVVQGCASLSLLVNADTAAYRELEVRTDALDDIYRGDTGFIKIDVEGFEDAVLDGARKTIERCRPNLLIEIDERFSPGGIVRVPTWLSRFDYRGFYVTPDGLAPIESFDPAVKQRVEDVPDLIADLAVRDRFPTYVNNFVFLAPAHRAETRARIDAKLATLATSPESSASRLAAH